MTIQVILIFPDKIFNPFLLKPVFFFNYVLDNFLNLGTIDKFSTKERAILVLSCFLGKEKVCEADRLLILLFLLLLLLLLFSFDFF